MFCKNHRLANFLVLLHVQFHNACGIRPYKYLIPRIAITSRDPMHWRNIYTSGSQSGQYRPPGVNWTIQGVEWGSLNGP